MLKLRAAPLANRKYLKTNVLAKQMSAINKGEKTNLAFVITAAFGIPVVPDVYMYNKTPNYEKISKFLFYFNEKLKFKTTFKISSWRRRRFIFRRIFQMFVEFIGNDIRLKISTVN